jgi:hypothetical protein
LPPWLAGELVDVLGAGVVQVALDEARARDKRPGADAYYDAFATEVAVRAGEDESALAHAQRALAGLSPGELLLRARTLALSAEAARTLGKPDALRYYEEAFQADPGVFRRLSLQVPVRFEVRGDDIAEKVASRLEGSPRLDVEDAGLLLRVDANHTGGTACLFSRDQSTLGCGRVTAIATDDAGTIAAKLVRDFHEKVFAPRIDMSQSDINSLDGTNLVRDDALRTLFDGDTN